MNRAEQKMEFIKLRTKGETFSSIAKTIKVAKQTVINWSKDDQIKQVINEARLLEYQGIVKRHEADQSARIKYLAELGYKIKQELLSRDLSTIPTDKLLKMYFGTSEQLLKELPTYKFSGDFCLKLGDYENEWDPNYLINPAD